MAGAEAVVRALDERHHVAILVHCGEVNRVAVLELRIAGRHTLRGLGHVNALGLPRGVRLGDQLRDRQVFLHLRVGVKFGPVGERQFLGLGEQVNVVG